MRKIIALLLAAMMLVLVCGCGETASTGEETTAGDTTTDAGSPADDNKEVKIGIAAPDVTHGWVAGVAYYAEKYCKEHNVTYKITVSANATEMAANLDDLVVWGADAIVIWPQWTGMEDAVAEVIAKNIPVVSFDVDIDCEGIYKVTGNNYAMGYESAKYIVEKVGEAADIVVLDVPSAGSVSELRLQGFMDYLDEINYDKSGVFQLGEQGFSRDISLKDMSDVLETHDHIDAIFSMDDESSIGAIQAITEAGRDDIKAITGGGGMQEYFRMIADPEYAHLGLASALYSPSMVENAIASAIAICNGETCEPVIVIPTQMVTSENVESFIDDGNTVY